MMVGLAIFLHLSPQDLQPVNLHSSSYHNHGLAHFSSGAFAWGVLVDIVGRKWAFNMTVLISSVFGLCLGVSNSYTTLLALAAFVGFSMGGNIPIDTTIALEFTP